MATYISGFVVAMAPLCLAVMSPLIGYFVSIDTLNFAVHIHHTFSILHTVASLLGSEVYTACWTHVGWWIPHSLRVLSS